MGLDGVEIVIEVEDRFGITIRDGEAQNVRTVGELLALINGRLAARVAARCPSLGAFLEVRRLLRSFLVQPTLRLKPSTTIASVVPAGRRRELWQILSDRLESPAHPLRRPRSLRILLVIAACTVLGFGAATALVDTALLPLGILGAIAIVIALHLVTTPLRIVPPATMETVGDISRRLAGLSAATGPVVSPNEVLAIVQTIVADVLGVRPDSVIPEARFVDDLGMA